MGHSSTSRKLTTSLLVGIVIGTLTVVAVRSRPAPDYERADASPDTPAPIRLLERLERAVFDGLAAWGARSSPANADIVLVALDPEAIKREREKANVSPLPRERVGHLAEELRALGAKLVVIDGVFSDASASDQTGEDDRRFAQSIDRAGQVVLGFGFAGVSERGPLEMGRWAFFKGSYPSRTSALLAAAPLLARGSRPYLVASQSQIEIWLGGYRDRAAALADGERLNEDASPGSREAPAVRELSAEETLDRVSAELLFSERNALRISGARSLSLKTFKILEPPISQLIATSGSFGSVGVIPDDDGVVRWVRHLVQYEGHYYPSLALAAALRLTGASEVSFQGGRLSAGRVSTPIDWQGATLLRRYGHGEAGGRQDTSYPIIPASTLLKSAERRQEGKSTDERFASRIRGKVAFVPVGGTAFTQDAPSPMAGGMAATQATAAALDNLMRADGLQRASTDRDSVLAFVWAMLGVVLSLLTTRSSRMLRTLWTQAALSLAVGGGLLFWTWQAYRAGLWTAAAVPMLGFMTALAIATFVHWVDEAKIASLVRDTLGKNVSPAILEQVLRNPQHLSPEGEQRVMTVCFVDVQDFTGISEKLKPAQVVRLLNDFLTDVSGVIDRNRGQVDKFIGDSAMAYWGAPLPNHLHAEDACRCALEISALLATRRPQWRERYGADLQARLGINTGDMVLGDMGSRGARRKVNYTAIGEPVNLASRLEDANKCYSTEILIGEGTREAAADSIEVREIDLIRVKNRLHPVRIFELLAVKGSLSADQAMLAERFDEALAAYRRRDFRSALASFETLAAKFPLDGPTAVYLERCRAYSLLPPPEGWDGVWRASRG